METIDVKNLKKNPDIIRNHFIVKNNIVYVNTDVMVMFPTRYINKKLAIMDSVINLLGIYAIIDDDNNYGVCLAPIMQNLIPTNTSDVMVGDTVYKALFFDKNSIFMPNNNLVQRDNFIYEIFDEFYIQGKIPWFLDYVDVSKLFLESKKYMGNKIGSNYLVFEILTSIISRLPDDNTSYFRTIANDKNKYPSYIGLNNPYYSFTTTGAKLIGSRFNSGLNTALIDPETKPSETTNILRR